MTADQRLTLILSFISVIGAPSLIFSLRVMAKWTRVESRLEEMVRNTQRLVEDKDRAHQVIQTQIHDDRAATDRRLRWLEERLWGREKNTNG